MALTPTATLSLAQEAPPTRHPEFPLANPPQASPAAYQVMSFPMLSPPPPFSPNTSHPKESWQKYSEANKDTNDRSRQAALTSAFITSYFCHTQKLLMKPPSCVRDGLHSAVTLASGARGFHETVRGQ